MLHDEIENEIVVFFYLKQLGKIEDLGKNFYIYKVNDIFQHYSPQKHHKRNYNNEGY